MEALKCDACGKFYEKPISVPDIAVSKYVHGYGNERYDLCKDCQAKLETFLGEDKKSENTR